MFYASYGSFMHDLLADFYSGKISKDKMYRNFLVGFSDKVQGERPSSSIASDYIDSGKNFIKEFSPIPVTPIGVEKKIDFSINDLNFTCRIDLLGKTQEGLYIIDHKSRGLKPKSGRIKPTQNDKEIDNMMRQLYIYSAAVKQEYGEFPLKLALNSFRSGNLIEEEFSTEKYKKAIDWAMTIIGLIENTSDFHPVIEYFPCRYICDVKDKCCYNSERR